MLLHSPFIYSSINSKLTLRALYASNRYRLCRISALGPAVHSATSLAPEFPIIQEDEGARDEPIVIKQMGRNSTVDATQTGAFNTLPLVSPSRELLESALKRASRVPVNKKLKNEAKQAKNKAARQLDTLTKELCVPLGSYIKGFPPTERLHPFERALLELTLGAGTYETTLAKVDSLRKSTIEVGKAYATRASRALNKRDAISLQEEGFIRMEGVFSKGSAAVDDLKNVAKSLRRLPVVETKLPTVALVGAPNVGKSSLVQLLSTGLPEIRDYPFTTRSIKMGHFYINGKRHQVTDTPGLLLRSDDDRNAMEKLTLASLQYLPTAVLFVTDLTGHCGMPVADQWKIRRELRERFPGKLWLDVFSKADLLDVEFSEADDRIAEQNCSTEESSTVENAVQFATSLSKALRVSSMSGDGVDELKEAMITMMSN